MFWILFVCLFSVLVTLRAFLLLLKNYKGWLTTSRSTVPSICPAKLMVVLGSGGHTGEMLGLLRSLNPKLYAPRVYVLAQTDAISLQKIEQIENEAFNNEDFTTLVIPRSRELHQSWISTVYSTLLSILRCIPIILTQKPDLVLCNGPGTCVPICLVFWNAQTKIVFIESVCRVRTLSLTGKIMLFLADECLVQWPELAGQFPRVRYLGRLI